MRVAFVQFSLELPRHTQPSLNRFAQQRTGVA